MTDKPEALRLADELDAYHTRSCHKEAAAELRRLHAEVEQYKRDAERYRWLRQRWGRLGWIGGGTDAEYEELRDVVQAGSSILDEAIDAAMREEALREMAKLDKEMGEGL